MRKTKKNSKVRDSKFEKKLRKHIIDPLVKSIEADEDARILALIEKYDKE
jgi:hypothetical protein